MEVRLEERKSVLLEKVRHSKTVIDIIKMDGDIKKYNTLFTIYQLSVLSSQLMFKYILLHENICAKVLRPNISDTGGFY